MAKKKKKKKNIVRYRRPLSINIGMVMFFLIFVYMVFSVFTYIGKDKVVFYEVQEGSIVNNKDYTGVIVREEEAKQTQESGFINYYIKEGKRASVGSKVYSIDETGSMEAFLKENVNSEWALSPEYIYDLKKQLTSFTMNYENQNFSEVYDIDYTMKAAVRDSSNFDVLNNLDQMMKEKGIRFKQVTADQAGVIAYTIDSMEELTIQEISQSTFEKTDYTKVNTKMLIGEPVEAGTPIYKVITSEKWSLVFPLSEEEVELYQDASTLRVAFQGKDLTATGAFDMISGSDGTVLGKIDFNEYVVQFMDERFVDFEIIQEQNVGLKIPVTAVTSKEFFLVPMDYLTTGGDSTQQGVNREVYSDEGTSVLFTPVEVYYSTEEYAYIEESQENGILAGAYFAKPDSTERYQLAETASLEGVYNINKGYAVFKQIEILSSNDEYHSVRKNMPYGLSVYDHIVLDAKTVTEGELVYQ